MTRLLTTTAISGGVLLALSTPMNAQTPLPPIEVRAPKAFELGQIKVGERRLGVPTKVAQPGAGAGVGGVGAPPLAWVPSEKTDNGPTPSQHTDAFGGYTITNRQMETFARPTLDSAVNIAPGVNSQISGNSRNEQNIYVRGFDRWQVPLTVDGVRVYLPVDNRLDFARFLTADIAEVQIAKGYVSVLDGPGGMGGQINLVTRRPTREIEAEWRTRLRIRSRRHIPGADDLRLRRHEKGHVLCAAQRHFSELRRLDAARELSLDHWLRDGDFAVNPIRKTTISMRASA